MEDKKNCLDLLLQHSIPEALARSCIENAATEAELISNLKALNLSQDTQRLVQVLSFQDLPYKQAWLNVFLSHGLEPEASKEFLLKIKGGFPELTQTLRGLPIPQDMAESLISQVC